MGKLIEVFGISKTMRRLVRVEKKTNRRALAAVRRNAKLIQKRAIEYAPVDEGFLEDAIRIGEVRGGKNRFEFLIGVDTNKLGPSYTQRGFRYDIAMHEGSYRLGIKSAEKEAFSGKNVGPGYLSRAFKDYEKKVIKDVEEALRGSF